MPRIGLLVALIVPYSSKGRNRDHAIFIFVLLIKWGREMRVSLYIVGSLQQQHCFLGRRFSELDIREYITDGD
jgi:hypothetical protein